ncbi:hypothetical protein PO909_004386 [Leuciscus waleckii]
MLKSTFAQLISRHLVLLYFHAPIDRLLDICTQHFSAQAQPEEDPGCFSYKNIITSVFPPAQPIPSHPIPHGSHGVPEPIKMQDK